MNESTEIIVGAIVGAALWLAWGLFSETRRNNGLLVAFLIPLAPIFIPVLFIVFVLIKYTPCIQKGCRPREFTLVPKSRRLMVQGMAEVNHIKIQ